MIENLDGLDQRENAFDRAMSQISVQAFVTQDLKIVPLDFALAFDNFRTVRMCRLIWHHGYFLGVAFKS